jgi:hypothetical protein
VSFMDLPTSRPTTTDQVPEDSPVGFLKSLAASIPLRLSTGSGSNRIRQKPEIRNGEASRSGGADSFDSETCG